MEIRLNILFALRQDSQTNPGGDFVQMTSWRTALEQAGYAVKLSDAPEDEASWRGCDIVFIWHLERVHDSYCWFKEAKQHNVPVVLVPTYYRCSRRLPGFGLFKQAELIVRSLWKRSTFGKALFKGWSRCRKEMLSESELLIANSEAERQLLIFEGGDAGKIAVIPNVVAQKYFSLAAVPFEERTQIVCVGHFCPRKNQLALIKALKGLPLGITFIGGARPMHERYWRRCRKLAGNQHKFTGCLSQDETVEILKKSKYAVSVSSVETPGIANLEAAASGCGLILPDVPPVREYFVGSTVHYIDPEHIDPEQLLRMLQTEPDARLPEMMKAKYSEAVLPGLWKNLQLERLVK